MIRQPKLMKLLADCYLLIALSFPVQVIILNGFSLFDVNLIINSMTTLNIIVCGLCIGMAFSLKLSSSVSLVLLPLLTTAVFYNNYLVGMYEYQFTNLQALFGSVLFLTLSSSVYLVPAVRNPLLDGGKRWWQTPKRLKTSFETSLYPFVGACLSGTTFDLSETGFFIADDGVRPKSNSNQFKGIQNELRVGDRTSVIIKVSSSVSVKCEARVVRRSAGSGSYPSGLGFKFEKLDGLHRKMIRHMIQDTYA